MYKRQKSGGFQTGADILEDLSSKGFDKFGNYTFGIKEHIIFPEIDYDKVDKIRGMDICISTSAIDDESGEALLRAMKFPFKS